MAGASSRGHAPIQILGAGLTGMSAGKHLGGGYELHERLPHPGGHAITLEEDGFRFDRTGHLLHLRDPAMREWVHAMVGHDAVQIDRRSRIFSHGVYTRYPYQANTFGLPPEVAYECLIGYLEALRTKDSGPEPRTFEEFCVKHFGPGFSRHFMIPYNQKLWGVHPSEITAAWCSRFVPLPKLEDVIAGAVGKNDRELGYNAHFLYPRLGIGELPKAMFPYVAEHTRLEHAPVGIDWRRKVLRFADGEVPYRALISTTPLDTLCKLLDDAPLEVRAAAANLRCNPLYYLDAALDVPAGVDLHWVYVPEEKYAFYRIGCYSNFSEKMAPPGKSCLYIELSSRAEPDLAKLGPEISRNLVEMQIIKRPEEVRFMRVRHIGHAYVVFDHHYYESLEVIRPFLENEGIISAGRYGDWNYSAMEDALIFGRDAAKKAKEIAA